MAWRRPNPKGAWRLRLARRQTYLRNGTLEPELSQVMIGMEEDEPPPLFRRERTEEPMRREGGAGRRAASSLESGAGVVPGVHVRLPARDLFRQNFRGDEGPARR